MSANIRDTLKACAFSITLLAAISRGGAADYYVDYANGNDTAAGTSTSTAWQHCPGDTALISGVDKTFVTASSYTTTGGPVAWNLTLATNITDGYIMVAVQGYYPVAPANVTWGGANLTYLGGSLSSGSTAYVQFFGMPVGDISGGTYGIGVNLTSAGPGIFLGGAMLFQGISQANPVATMMATNSNVVSLTIPPNAYTVVGLGTYNGNQDQSFGVNRVYNNNNGAKLTAATSIQTGNQTFAFGSSGYPEATLAISLLLDISSGASSAQLGPNDVVHFKGGVTYVLMGSSGINVLQSGLNGRPITYDGNSDGTWGTGKALITDNHGTSGRIAFHFSYGQGSNVVIRNFDIGNIGGAAALPADTGAELPPNYAAGIVADVGFQNVTIADCYIHEIGYWQNVKPCGNNTLGGHGIRTGGANGSYVTETDGLTITNCELTKIRQPIQLNCFKSVVNVNIVNCYVHDYTEWCMDLALQTGSYMDNVSVHGCSFVDWDKYYSEQFWSGYESAPHQNGIYFRGDVAWCYPSTNINFYNNTYRSTGSWSGGTSGQYVEGPLQCNIYNNIFDNVHPANAAIVLQQYNGAATNVMVRILNNTFYVTSAAIYFTDDDADTEQNYTLSENNIFVNPIKGAGNNFLLSFNSRSATSFRNYVVPQTHMDFNSYEIYNISMPLDLVGIYAYFNVSGGNWLSMEGLRTFGWDIHSFTNVASFVNASVGDYHLLPGSPQINAGVNLSSLNLPGLNRDKDGNARPSVGPWTLGAYAVPDSSQAPYVTLAISPNTVVKGQSVTLTWMSLNATNLSLTGIGQVATDGSTNVVPLNNGAVYVITAEGANGTTSANVSVTVKPPPPVQFQPQ